MTETLWKPQNPDHTQMNQFINFVNSRFNLKIQNYFELHQWSVQNIADFWQSVWDFCEVKFSAPPSEIFIPTEQMQNTQWFQGARLNFAENLLKHRDNKTALIYVNENGFQESITYDELYSRVAKLANHLKQLELQSGDRVAGFLPNSIDTIVAMLATTSLGCVWSSCSPDFGLHGLLDRFSQIEPTVLFATNKHQYNGKIFHHNDTIKALQKQLPSLLQTIVVAFDDDVTELTNTIHYKDALANQQNEIEFTQVPFNHPLYILFSSGTTGKPKCMVHGVGGTLIQHLKELKLHCDLTTDDTMFFYTSCGWMMWNWLVSSLAVGATIVLYDGSPFFPNKELLFDLVDQHNISVMGVGAKLLETAEKFQLVPKQTHKLTSLRSILTTGSPLLPESFDYVYRDVKASVQLSSISGGSDIISCFALANPLLPVYCGELQCLGLGMDVKIYNEQGDAVTQQKGELVCVSPFPSMPIYFWNDANGSKYHKAYFERFANVWAHGDFAEITEHQGLVIYGRSDATLNPGGVRIGTAEIYNVVNQFSEITDCLAIDQTYQGNDRIILFVILHSDSTLDPELIDKMKATIRSQLSPRHVPGKIIAVPDLPRTINDKLVEIAVKNMVNNKPVNNLDAIANPESLKFFKNLPELR